MVYSLELREKRLNLIDQAQQIIKAAHAEERQMTPEETEKFDKIHADVDAMWASIERAEKQERMELEAAERRFEDRARRGEAPISNDPVEDSKLEERAFWQYIKGGVESVPSNERRYLRAHTEYRTQQEVATAGAGGYLVPEGFSNQLDVAMLAFAAPLSACDVIRTETGNPIPWPTMNDTATEGAVITEANQDATGSTKVDLTFAEIVLGCYMIQSKHIVASLQFVQDQAFGEGFLLNALAERLGRAVAQYTTLGTGTGQPKGIVTAAASGVTLGTGNTTSLTYAGLVDLEHSVNPAYRSGAAFMLSDGALAAAKKIVDSEGRPIWGSYDARDGAPGRILGYPYYINYKMATPAPNAKTVLFGDLKKFKIRIAKGYTIVRLTERFAPNFQIGWIGHMRFDSNLINAGTDPVKYLAQSAT